MEMKSYFIGTILLLIIAAPSVALTPPALFVYGDSLVDVGNNNYLPDPAPKANFPFHGIDYPGSISTGRFGNGYIGPDYLARYMGFLQSPPPYLSITNENQMLRGVNFASAGSGILNSTGEGTISLERQVMYFQEVARNLSRRAGNLTANKLLSKSIFCISSGSNDIFAYFLAYGPQNKTTNDQFIATLVKNLEIHLKTLYNSGGRKIVALGTSVLGCIPIVRSQTPSGDCSKDLNNLSIQFKNETRVLLQSLTSTLKELTYSFVDAYEMANEIAANARQYGFTELTNACCGMGRYNGEAPCTPNSNMCSNRCNHNSWDQYHPTQAIAELVSQWSFYGSKYVSPMNIQ
ncbi:GDSL esterase/lipase At5g55050-like [Dioscorea cayenensis subsp. rotundata]|uniref:GDSL esterase/lipase At5g55050-like n=1 Tax=Dioscorea cayennensis subsp. rotundata TaxID=55577 RepID=A0AB40C7U7_DIOCR|nr:GDSL esterase/lipase At5g55050-like [Dioscorea cayenensis subsp. rotundata]